MSTAFVLLLPAVAESQDDSSHFSEWWSRLTANGASGPQIDHVSIRYTIAPLGTDSGPPAVGETACQIWRSGTMWRWNRDNPGGGLSYLDFVWGDGIEWQMTPDSIAILDQAGDSSPLRIDSAVSSTAHDIQLLLGANIGAAVGNQLDLVPVRKDSAHWSARASTRRADGRVLEFSASGEWHSEEGWGSVSRTEFATTAPDGSRSAEAVEAADWKLQPGLRLGIPAEVRVYENGRPVQVYRVHSAVPYTDAAFKSLIYPPGPSDVDPSRGRVTYRGITDLRGGGVHLDKVDPGARTSSPVVLGDYESSNRRLRTAGWAAAGAMITSLVLLRIRSRWSTPRRQ